MKGGRYERSISNKEKEGKSKGRKLRKEGSMEGRK